MFNTRETSRHQGKPVNLYLFRGVEPSLEVMMRSVTIIPGTTEFGYGTTPVSSQNPLKTMNQVSSITNQMTDFKVSVEDLMVCAPKLKHVSLVVAWHGTDLRINHCQIKPKVESAELPTIPYEWRVGNLTRASADVVSQIDDKPALGGAPSDRTVYEAISFLKSKGLKVTLYPFIMMDIPSNNSLPDPYGSTAQSAYPWRGRINVYPAPGRPDSPDATSEATTQVNAFFGTAKPSHFAWNGTDKHVDYTGPTEWSFRRFIMHMATIAAAAGADDFLIGSEMVSMTRIRSAASSYPAVNNLVTLAGNCRTILGSGVKISYAADWSEYHSHSAGSNLIFNLDPLWASPNIDYIGIDNYLPIGDWRDGTDHLDYQAGFLSPYEKEYIQGNIEGGEYFDWYYTSQANRTNQIRTPITDGAYGEPWVYRQKDIRSWATFEHHNRINGVRSNTKTVFNPGSKKIVFTELGLPAVEKAINQPNVFVDPKSVESAFPYFSNQNPDAAIQRAGLEASLDYWRKHGGSLIDYDKISLWTWDARPYPTFPMFENYYSDAPNWQLGHWLTGRLRPGFGLEASQFGPYAFCDGEEPITRAGITYQPWPVEISDITSNGNLDKSDITVTLARGSDFENEFIGFPPSHVVNLIVFQGHIGDSPSLVDYPAVWVGRVGAPIFENTSIAFNCVPVSTTIQQPGLRRNYQLSCPHVLYGPQCRASKNASTVSLTVTSVSNNTITLNAALPYEQGKYRGGLLEWTTAGLVQVRTIVNLDGAGTVVIVRGNLRGISVGSTVKISLGCNRRQSDCSALHNNILNFGGQPFIPLENPLSQKNIFY